MKSHQRTVLSAALLLCAAVALQVSSAQLSAATETKPKSSSTCVAPASTAEVKARAANIDGAMGGQIKCSKWTLIVPPGAFRGEATITMCEKGEGERMVSLTITPESLNNFRVPVQLLYQKTDVTEDIGNESIYWWNPGTSSWEPVASQRGDVVQGTLTAGLPHFSTYAVKGGRAGW